MLGNPSLRLYGVMEYTGIQLFFLGLVASKYLQAIVGEKDAFPEGLILPWDLPVFEWSYFRGTGASLGGGMRWKQPLFHGQDSWCRVRRKTT